jgi:hypothetical protein
VLNNDENLAIRMSCTKKKPYRIHEQIELGFKKKDEQSSINSEKEKEKQIANLRKTFDLVLQKRTN